MTETNTQRVVSFDDISPTNLTFSEQYRCTRSTAGQVVAGLSWSVNNVSSTKEQNTNYQASLYPMICQLGTEVFNKYMETFINNVSDPVQRQVYGANLNGARNDGRLNRAITCKNVRVRLTYQYSQFGQLLSLLYDRLNYISGRDVTKIQRYVDNEQERQAFVSLQNSCKQFCTYLRGDDNSVMSRWSTFVTTTRQQNNIQIQEQPIKNLNFEHSRGRGRGRGRYNFQNQQQKFNL